VISAVRKKNCGLKRRRRGGGKSKKQQEKRETRVKKEKE
jgi:hypothetical protein